MPVDRDNGGGNQQQQQQQQILIKVLRREFRVLWLALVEK
jgi:hypothetical protein